MASAFRQIHTSASRVRIEPCQFHTPAEINLKLKTHLEIVRALSKVRVKANLIPFHHLRLVVRLAALTCLSASTRNLLLSVAFERSEVDVVAGVD